MWKSLRKKTWLIYIYISCNIVLPSWTSVKNVHVWDKLLETTRMNKAKAKAKQMAAEQAQKTGKTTGYKDMIPTAKVAVRAHATAKSGKKKKNWISQQLARPEVRAQLKSKNPSKIFIKILLGFLIYINYYFMYKMIININ